MTKPDHSIAQALACAAITPGLHSVLAFDASPARLRAIEATLARMLAGATGRTVRSIDLGPTTTDNALWGAYRISPKGRPIWSPGPLVNGDHQTLAVIGNLTMLGLEAQRTLVAVVGADSAHLERHGQSERWAPATFWLAACARADAGKISPHLLDRFAVRIDGAGPEQPSSRQQLLDLVSASELAKAPTGDELSHDVNISGLAERRQRSVAITEEALDRILEYFPDAAIATRRSITLARLAIAHARLRTKTVNVTVEVVDAVAEILGLPSLRRPEVVTPTQVASVTPPVVQVPSPESQVGGHYVKPPDDPTIHKTDEPAAVPTESIAVIAVTYQEDRAEVARDASSLVFPAIQQRSTVRALRGAVVGVMKTHELRDLAITRTIIEAAMRHALRGDNQIHVIPADLHRYRRVAPVERMLALVLDYTCLAGWDWGAAVLPYLRTAYMQRASISLIQVGAALEPGTRARQFVSRSVLAAPLAEVFSAKPGRATPLAHGLELAFETVRHALQHGRGVATRAQLVVVTDGRGNVPLEASRRGEIPRDVRDKGVRDSLKIADKLRGLDRLDSIVIEPPPSVATQLPIRLAVAMGAQLRSARMEIVE